MNKQFLLKKDGIYYLDNLRILIKKNLFPNFNIRIENGFILQQSIEFSKKDFSIQKVLSNEINIPLEQISNKTAKFKITEEDYNFIKSLTELISDELNMRIYTAFTVKILLKNYFIALNKKL